MVPRVTDAGAWISKALKCYVTLAGVLDGQPQPILRGRARCSKHGVNNMFHIPQPSDRWLFLTDAGMEPYYN